MKKNPIKRVYDRKTNEVVNIDESFFLTSQKRPDYPFPLPLDLNQYNVGPGQYDAMKLKNMPLVEVSPFKCKVIFFF